jgi:hypothetical protein
MALTHALMGRTLESGRFTRHDALLEVMTQRSREGFTEHFVVGGNQLLGLDSGTRFDADQVVIRGIDRIEGDSDPDDEEIVYAIETVTGLRGTLADALGVYASPVIGAFLSRIPSGTGRPRARRDPDRGADSGLICQVDGLPGSEEAVHLFVVAGARCYTVQGSRPISHEGSQRSLDTPGLDLRDQAGQHLDEVRVLGARQDVLPTIGSEQADFESVPVT